MVRSASGVTWIRQRAVGGPSGAGGTSKATPVARMSCTNTSPSWSSRTLPMNAARPPREATPAMVLAAEPPEAAIPDGMASYSSPDLSALTRVMAPFTNPWATMNESSTEAITSTMALPTPITSSTGSKRPP